MEFSNFAAYQFIHIDHLDALRIQIKSKCLDLDLKGTVLLAEEGINCFVSGADLSILDFQTYLEKDLSFNDLCIKINPCSGHSFTRMLVKVKKEIITFGNPNISPRLSTGKYIAPRDLQKWFENHEDFILLDVRNHYEITAGAFRNSVHLNLESFREFSNAARNLPSELKKKPIVTVCTGGIRCEKATAWMLESGFNEVYQLKGGILNYFQECGDAFFEGNCFVFDWRLSVDRQLLPKERSQAEPINAGRHRIKTKKKHPV